MALTPRQLRELRRTPVDETGNRVKKAMDLVGIKQHALSQEIGFSQQYISDVARGRHQTVTVENAYPFCEFFGCDIEDLFPRQRDRVSA